MSNRGQKVLGMLPESIQRSVSRSWKDDEHGMPWWLGWAFFGFVVVLWANRRRRGREDSTGFLLSTSWPESTRPSLAPSVIESSVAQSPAVVTVEDITLEPPTLVEPLLAEIAQEGFLETGTLEPTTDNDTDGQLDQTSIPQEQTPDDLTKIEGIGPKIASLLEGAGITTFAGLATTDVEHVREIVRGAGLNLADPSTWPEQAGLAAANDWDSLKTLQEQLKGGRII